jgi:hypothetical protein
MNRRELNEAEELLKSAREMVDTERELVEGSIKDFGYSPEAIRAYVKEYPVSHEEETTDEEPEVTEGTADDLEAAIKENQEKYKEETKAEYKKRVDEDYAGLAKQFLLDADGEIPEDTEEARETLVESIAEIAELLESESDVMDLEKNLDDEYDKYMAYLASPEYNAKQDRKIEELTERLEKLEADTGKQRKYVEIKKIKKDLALLKGRYDFSYMTSRVSIDNTVENFFDKRKSNYMMEKFYAKCKTAKLNSEMYHHFTNIEEKFLDEKYSPFNNLFLFHCMRYIANADPVKDLSEIKLTFNILGKIVYNRFPGDEFRQKALDAITAFLDQVIEAGYTDRFKADNISYPQHPVRLAKVQEENLRLRNAYITTLNKEFNTVLSLKQYEDMSNEDLEKYTVLMLSLKRDFGYNVTNDMFGKSLDELKAIWNEESEKCRAEAEAENAAEDGEESEEASETKPVDNEPIVITGSTNTEAKEALADAMSLNDGVTVAPLAESEGNDEE